MVKILRLRLRKARLDVPLTQMEVFRRCGVNNKTLSGYENGVSEPDAETLRVLAALYGVSVDWLLGHDEGSAQPVEDDFSKFVRYMEEKYQVSLFDDAILLQSLYQLVEVVAQTKNHEKQNTRLRA